jgi:nitrite reductase (NADH) large subunit
MRPNGASAGAQQRRPSNWHFVCEIDEILPDAGVAALIDGKQIAIFRVGSSDTVHAISNFDPHSEANVLSRGLVGDVQAEPVVASPIYKHHFSLITGRCIEDADMSVPVYPARVSEGRVWVKSEPARSVARTRRLVVVATAWPA